MLLMLLVATLAISQTTPQSSSTVYNDAQSSQTPNNTQQQPPAVSQRPAAAPARGNEIAAGTEIRATLDTALSTRTSHVGDRFTASVAQPVHAANGALVVPVGSKIEGEVIQAQQGKTLPSVRGKGQLNLRFRDIRLANGGTIPLTATLVSVNSTKGSKAGEEGQVSGGTSTKEAAKDVGIGAGVGTVAGLIFGHALRGLAIGAIAGGGYVLATQGKDVELPAQTGVVLRTDQSVMVPGSAPGR